MPAPSRHKARTDRNQPDIVKRLKLLGCSVIDLSAVGRGVCDLLVGFKARGVGPVAVLVEVKDGDKPPSARRLTPDQRRFFATFRGPAVVVNDPDEAELVVTAMRAGDFAVIRRPPFSERLPYPNA